VNSALTGIAQPGDADRRAAVHCAAAHAADGAARGAADRIGRRPAIA